MSLKTFHLIFITAASLLAFGFGAWLLRGDGAPEDGRGGDLASGLASVAVGVALVGYEVYFLRKTRKLGYL
jgi:hypothetical protein